MKLTATIIIRLQSPLKKHKNQKIYLTVPMDVFDGKLLGLVSMGSATVDYHLTGTATFDTPLGEVPVPVDIGRLGSNN